MALLLNGEGRQKNGNQAVLPERNAELRMPGDLKNELPIPPFIKELILGNSTDRESAEHERSRAEAKLVNECAAGEHYRVTAA